jgi:hypothetical protein
MPRDIARWVRFAISEGWVPEKHGPTFALNVPPEQLELERIKFVE